MRRAFLTGGLGFIGSHISRDLIENRIVDEVVCLDHYGRYVNSVSPDFTDYRKLRIQGISDHLIIERGEAKFFSVLLNLLDQYRPEYIFHLASVPLAKIDNLNTEEMLEGTVVSSANIMEALAQLRRRDGYRPRKIVYASSSMVYGDFLHTEATESDPTTPKNIYGTMKLAGENIILGLGKTFDLPVSIIRPSAVYGPTDMNRRVTQIFVEKAFQGQLLTIQGAEEMLDFTYVKDVARGYVLAAVSDVDGEVFNITHGAAHTLLEFVVQLQRHFPSLDFEVIERDQERPLRGTLSIEKARRMLNYEPEYSLERGVDEYVSFIRKTRSDYQRDNQPIG